MARLSIALALLATAHAFTGPLAPRAPQHKGLVQAPQKGVRNWLTKLRAAVADPAPDAAADGGITPLSWRLVAALPTWAAGPAAAVEVKLVADFFQQT